MNLVGPGAIVRFRGREWIVLPSEDPQLILLRPIGGTDRETCGVHRGLATLLGGSLPYERIEPAQFPLPDPTTVQDHEAVKLLLQSARLLLREGAAPFRALGRISFQPRPYQFVPLLMALRQNPVRLLIADDVGVGKTIEALLIARELLARGEIRRMAVLCPPYLCDQWHDELWSKASIQAPVVRSGTVARLERGLPPDTSLFAHYRHFVASIDLVKGERYAMPSFVIALNLSLWTKSTAQPSLQEGEEHVPNSSVMSCSRRLLPRKAGTSSYSALHRTAVWNPLSYPFWASSSQSSVSSTSTP